MSRGLLEHRQTRLFSVTSYIIASPVSRLRSLSDSRLAGVRVRVGLTDGEGLLVRDLTTEEERLSSAI